MSRVHASGVGARHAITRALATEGLPPTEATFRVEVARVDLDAKRRVVRAEATVEVLRARPLARWTPSELRGVVNPDGAHPLMAWIDGPAPFFLDVFPVTWERWARLDDLSLPTGLYPLCPRTDVTLAQAAAYAERVGKQLPSVAQLRAAWGPQRYTWGPERDPTRGRTSPPRFGELPEVGLYPPSDAGLFDLGAWLWHWTAEGTVSGGSIDADPAFDQPPAGHEPIGFRLACPAPPLG